MRSIWHLTTILLLVVGVTSSASAARRCVALTFDDGPHEVETPRLLGMLAEENVKATFYLVGQRVARWPQVVLKTSREGHELGNHSWNHPYLTTLSSESVRWQIGETDKAVEEATGKRPKTLRAPYGDLSDRIRNLFIRPFIGWGKFEDTQDYVVRVNSMARIDHTIAVAHRARAGTIVLMHDIHPTTVDAVPGVIKELKNRGLEFVTISEFMTSSCLHAENSGLHASR